MAEWLNTAFANFDGGVFSAVHAWAENAGGFFTPFFKIVSVIGEKGIIFFVLSVVLMLFSKTRKQGVCAFGALCFGVIIASFILKNVVARVRPYDANPDYAAFWESVGGTESDSFCFPSGHTTMATAAITALFLCFDKKRSWSGFIFVLLIAVSRVYLIAHYATDVIGGVIAGVVSAFAAYGVTALIYRALKKYENKKFFAFCLNADIKNIFVKESTQAEKSGDLAETENFAKVGTGDGKERDDDK